MFAKPIAGNFAAGSSIAAGDMKVHGVVYIFCSSGVGTPELDSRTVGKLKLDFSDAP